MAGLNRRFARPSSVTRRIDMLRCVAKKEGLGIAHRTRCAETTGINEPIVSKRRRTAVAGNRRLLLRTIVASTGFANVHDIGDPVYLILTVSFEVHLRLNSGTPVTPEPAAVVGLSDFEVPGG
jgi:hypothetical protein